METNPSNLAAGEAVECTGHLLLRSCNDKSFPNDLESHGVITAFLSHDLPLLSRGCCKMALGMLVYCYPPYFGQALKIIGFTGLSTCTAVIRFLTHHAMSHRSISGHTGSCVPVCQAKQLIVNTDSDASMQACLRVVVGGRTQSN